MLRVWRGVRRNVRRGKARRSGIRTVSRNNDRPVGVYGNVQAVSYAGYISVYAIKSIVTDDIYRYRFRGWHGHRGIIPERRPERR